MKPIPAPRRRHAAAALAMLALALAAPAQLLGAAETASPAPVAPEPELRVPYVPTVPEGVDKMLEMAKVGKNDLVDLNPKRIEEAESNLKEAGPEIAKRVRFITGDLFQVDISKATVVTLYLLPEVNLMLRPKLWKELAVGTRVVSHDYHMGDDWPPEETVRVANKVVYSWTIKPEHKMRA